MIKKIFFYTLVTLAFNLNSMEPQGMLMGPKEAPLTETILISSDLERLALSAIQDGNKNDFTACIRLALPSINKPLGNVKASAILLACQNRDIDTLRILLMLGCNPNIATDDGQTALTKAVENGDTEIASLLIQHGASVDALDSYGALISAAGEGKVEPIALLLKNNANPNVFSKKSKNRTALHQASQNGHTEVVRALLEHGAKPDAKDSNGYTPLIVASENGNTATVILLLKDSAVNNGINDTLCEEFLNRTALHQACQNGHTEVVRALLEYGAKPGSKDSNEVTPLDIAKAKKHTEIVILLEPEEKSL